MEDFYMTLRSDSSPCDYPNNTSANFCVKLPREIRLSDDDWQIALVSISYPYTFRNIKKNHNELVLGGLDNFGKEIEVKIVIPDGYYHSLSEVLKKLNIGIRQKINEDSKNGNASSSIPNSNLSKIETFFIEEKSQKVRVNSKLIAEFSQLIKKPKRIYFKGNLSTVLGFDFENHNLLNDHEGVHACNLNFGISPEIFLYLNIIYPQIIGHACAEIIKIFPTLDREIHFSGIVERNFTSRQYVKILTKNFRTINVQLKNNLDEFIEFIFGTVTAVFHVRRSKSDVHNDN